MRREISLMGLFQARVISIKRLSANVHYIMSQNTFVETQVPVKLRDSSKFLAPMNGRIDIALCSIVFVF